MILDDPVQELLLVARMLREDEDVFVPMITWQAGAGEPIVAHLTGLTGDTKDDLDIAFQRLRDITGPPEWFAVTLDSYARDGAPDDLGDVTLEEAFLQGDPRVIEQMVTIFMTPGTGELVMLRQVYRFLPSEGWEWSEPQVVESPGDAVTTAVRLFH
jgi:hypothetical protein